jgi:hypothetical protein
MPPASCRAGTVSGAPCGYSFHRDILGTLPVARPRCGNVNLGKGVTQLWSNGGTRIPTDRESWERCYPAAIQHPLRVPSLKQTGFQHVNGRMYPRSGVAQDRLKPASPSDYILGDSVLLPSYFLIGSESARGTAD